MDAQYSLDRDGQRYGPYTLDEITTYLAQGSVAGTDMVWTAGMPSWIPVSQLLAGAAPAPPPPPVVAPRPPIQAPNQPFTPSPYARVRSADSNEPLTEFQRPAVITLLAVLQFISSAFMAVLGLGTVMFYPSTDPGGWFVALFFIAFAALGLACGIGLWKLKPYGRTIQLVVAWIGLLGIPIGTIISVLILLYLKKPGIQVMFSGLAPGDLAPEQIADVRALSGKNSGMQVVLIVIVGFVLLVVVGGIVAAIAVPGLLRARMSGNEASAIGSLRAINSAQAMYSSKCGGYAPSLEALNRQGLLSPDLAGATSVVKSGYTITIEPAADAIAEPPLSTDCAGITDFVAYADPITPGSTGVRYFATDPRSTIYFDASTMRGGIPSSALPLQ